ncbi:flagellar motor switch protein FliG [Methylocystis sp. S23]|jgi:flagellar motor switch protein FliG
MTDLPVQEKSSPLDGAEKVAAVLLALDREASSRVLKHFDQNELRRVARVAASLGSVPQSALDEICAGLVEEIHGGEPDLVGGPAMAEELLASVLPDEQVADIMSDVRGSSNQFLWRRVAALPDKMLADYLSAERPQTIAIVLARVDPAVAARVLAQLPAPVRAQAMRRMLISKPAAEPVLHLIEEALQADLFATTNAPSTSEVSAKVAGIVNQLERDQINEVLAGLAEAEPILAEQLKALLFSFEDIVGLGQRARLVVFDQAPTDRVILALRESDAAMREAVLPCLSARTRRMVEAELAAPAEPPRREILAAQREIANLVVRLAGQGLIDLTAADGSA